MAEINKPDSNYWRSFEELYNDPKAIEASHHEFQEGVTDNFDPGILPRVSRRKFFALLSASSALAAAGCTSYRDKGEIIPYITKPEEITPGKASYYSSSCDLCSNGCGILVKTREGRPVKIDGNADHPVNKGKVCIKGQANIVNLYDPERLSAPFKKGGAGNFVKIDWKKADAEILSVLTNSGDKEIALITKKIISPTELKALNDFKSRYPSVKIYSYDLFNNTSRSEAWRRYSGNTVFPLIKWDEANVIVALESDFLGSEGNTVENAILYSGRRDSSNPGNFNRLYVVEGNMSATGMNADHRIKVRPDAQYELLISLIKEFSGSSGSLNNFANKYKIPSESIQLLLKDLSENRGKSIIYAGETLSIEAHTAVNHLNRILGNESLYRSDTSGIDLLPYSKKEDFETLTNNMNLGAVAVVIHYDTNPVYHLAPDYGYKEALKNVPLVVTLCEKDNESSFVSHFVLPINHNLESWGDIKTRTGVYSLKQPVIYPIFSTRQKESILLTWINGNSNYYNLDLYRNYLKDNWKNNLYSAINSSIPFDTFWVGALHDGVVLSSEIAEINQGATGNFQEQQFPETNGYVLTLKASNAIGDGRFSGNGWMQELPHPVSKITWDNYASISTKTADELQVKNDDLIEIDLNGKKLKIPVYIQPGAADKTISIELGYGRENNGIISQSIGFNANILMSKDKGLSPWIYNNVKVSKAAGSYKLVSAQEHHAFDKGLTQDVAQKRNIIVESTVAGFLNDPRAIEEERVHKSLYPPHTDYQKGVKWAMSIDLNKCTGCSECVISCVAENNIPVVGKDQVDKGREMHWLRIDRYYSGNPENPKVSLQPMLCQHCDHAPCENVCPVVATTHSPDGLNQMAYNRCVGTRYCSNNCPYKVRRFNFFNFRDHFDDGIQQNALFNLVYNPEVTVRSRGVMEKCTFCIQRIMEAREESIKEGRQLKGSDVHTACQEACVTSAINFGDMNDKSSAFQKNLENPLAYYVLDDLNTRPNITYLAKLRNIAQEVV